MATTLHRRGAMDGSRPITEPAAYLIVIGELSFLDYLWRYGVPVLTGNTIGGVVLVAR